MKIERFGSCKLLDALCERLQQKCIVEQKPTPVIASATHLTGLRYENITVDINCGLHWHAQQHALDFADDEYLELSSFWHPHCAKWGFYLFVAGSARAKKNMFPILNILAPQAGIWLDCGAAGSASFTATVLNSLAHPMNNLPETPQDFAKDIWLLWIEKQYLLLKQLFVLSTDYLNSNKNNKAHADLTNKSFAEQLALHIQQVLTPLLANI